MQLFKLMMENLNVNRRAEGRDFKKIISGVIQPPLMNTAVKAFVFKMNLILKIIPQKIPTIFETLCLILYV